MGPPRKPYRRTYRRRRNSATVETARRRAGWGGADDPNGVPVFLPSPVRRRRSEKSAPARARRREFFDRSRTDAVFFILCFVMGFFASISRELWSVKAGKSELEKL